MEIHDRFIKQPTASLDVLEVLAENPDRKSATLRNLITAYYTKVFNNVSDLRTLETYRMILCYQYQSHVNSCNKDDTPKCTVQLYTDLRNFFIKDNKSVQAEELAVLYDIAVLQLVLFDRLLLTTSFKQFCDNQELLSSAEGRALAMRVSACFADSYNLRTLLYKETDNAVKLQEHAAHILMIIQSWIKQEEGFEWKLLASLLPKLTITFGPEKIVPPIWSQVIGPLTTLSLIESKEFVERIDLEKSLAVLCAMADVCFPSEEETVHQLHYEQCLQHKFWVILSQGLVSLVQQQRKQALYLTKRALDFMDTHESEIKRDLTFKNRALAVPFFCTRPGPREPSLEEAKKHFFLILEVLEEKQKHLVLPALSHVPSLVKVCANHESCCEAFAPIWLCCIFKRIVQHDNESVKLLGLREILTSDRRIFNDDFLHFLVGALNNTFLYECSIDEVRPEIRPEVRPEVVKKLEECLLRWEQERVTLINTFVRALSSVSWGPVAIYWILRAILAVSERCEIVVNVWGYEELRRVEDLIKKSLTKHNLQLRTYSQALIGRIFRAFVSMPATRSSLECIFNILSSLPDNECFWLFSDEKNRITEHLSKIIKPCDALNYFTERCEKFVATEQSLKSFALTITLLAGSKLIFAARSCPAERVLRNLLDNIVDADLRPYADQNVILKVVELSAHLFTSLSLLRTDDSQEVLTLMSPYGDEIVKIVSRSLDKRSVFSCDEYASAISALLRSEFSNVPAISRQSNLISLVERLERLEDKCIRIFTNPDDFCRAQWSYAVKNAELYQTYFHRPELRKAYVPLLLKYFTNQVTSHGQGSNAAGKEKEPNGKFTSDCFENVAKIVNANIVTFLDPWQFDINWFQELLVLVEYGNEHVIEPVVSALCRLLQNSHSLTAEEIHCVLSIVRLSCRCLFQSKKTLVFFRALDVLTTLIVDSTFLDLDGAAELAVQCLHQIMEEGESVPMMKQSFIGVRRHSPLQSNQLLIFEKALMSCLLHGSVPRRDQLIERTAVSHAQHLDGALSFPYNDLTVNSEIRTQAIHTLMRAIKSELGGTAQLREKVLNNLLEILERNKNKRYFDNSHLHRLKHRVMQTLLLLEPSFNEAEQRRLYDALGDLLIAESNQPSVRLMHEWLLVRLSLKNADMREAIWTLFETAAEKRPGSIVSLASVVFHVAQSLTEQTQTQYIGKAITQLLPNCMGQQFSVRLYSQAIIVKIYEMLPEGSPETETYRGVYTGVGESLRRGNLMKNSTRVLDDFYFKIFDATEHYNFETIYYELPRLTNVANDEWISPTIFDDIYAFERNNVHRIIQNIEKQKALRMAKPSAKSSKATGELDESTELGTDCGLSDIQKKIIPWKNMVPFYDDLSEASKAKLVQRKMMNEDAGIIVVASLIDRPPNLGGIARTCEIFGAKELVIGSLRYVENREFQTLSVSAEKWITITEVKPHLLKNYLLEKQSEGWKLIGAEQTANSTNLLEMEFPKKTILLLGNERDGIPANLIPLLDVCVEIPQNGVVRSLNVHVTGAICIWQYTKHHVLT